MGLSSAVVLSLVRRVRCRGIVFYFFKNVVDDRLGVVTLQDKICDLLSFGFEVVIDGTKTAKS